MKKFSDFIDKKKVVKKTNNVVVNDKVEKLPELKYIKSDPSGVVPSNTKKSEISRPGTIKENFNFYGNIVSVNGVDKVSEVLNILIENNISKDKLNYVLLERKNEIVVFKYNKDKGFRVGEFVENTILYLKENEKFNKLSSEIQIERSNEWVRISNIDSENSNILKYNLIKLLK